MTSEVKHPIYLPKRVSTCTGIKSTTSYKEYPHIRTDHSPPESQVRLAKYTSMGSSGPSVRKWERTIISVTGNQTSMDQLTMGMTIYSVLFTPNKLFVLCVCPVLQVHGYHRRSNGYIQSIQRLLIRALPSPVRSRAESRSRRARYSLYARNHYVSGDGSAQLWRVSGADTRLLEDCVLRQTTVAFRAGIPKRVREKRTKKIK